MTSSKKSRKSVMTRTMLSLAGFAGLVSTFEAGALAAPTSVTVTPPSGARFLKGQRFDLRVEGKGTGPFSATLAIDGTTVPFTSGEQDTTTTDGISAAGFGGFNLRGFSDDVEGPHQITATLTDSTGSVEVKSSYTVVNPWGRGRPAKNVIIMLGDGMGVAHRTAARIVRYGVTAGDPTGFLAMDQFPGTGFVTTHSLNSIITDSAPGMSGYVTGNHQNNNQEGVWPANVSNPFYAPRVEYLSEYFHRTQGKALGLVTTADIEDATPAANAVHTLLRGNGTGIIDQYLDESDANDKGDHGTGLRVLLGGGRRWFLPAGQFGSSRAATNDYDKLPADLLAGWHLPAGAAGALDPARDTLAAFQSAGFTYVEDATQLDAVRSAGPRHAPKKLLGLFGYGNMNVALDKLAKRRGVPLPGATGYLVDDYHAPNQPMLDEMTEAALKVLGKSRRGFVLMVEGAHIDKQSHAMDPERAIVDTLEFDRAIALARQYAERDGETLVLVLSDHECSGFSVIGALTGGVAALATLPSDAAVLDPAVVPARQKLIGTYDLASFPLYNILPDGYPQTMDIDGKLLIGYGASGDRFETWQTNPTTIIDSLLPNDIKGELGTKGYGVEPADRPERKASGFFLRGQAVGHTQAVHTAADIPVSAFATNRGIYRQFVGIQKNTDVFFKISRALLGGY
jgi:alkaline phosphatase